MPSHSLARAWQQTNSWQTPSDTWSSITRRSLTDGSGEARYEFVRNDRRSYSRGPLGGAALPERHDVPIGRRRHRVAVDPRCDQGRAGVRDRSPRSHGGGVRSDHDANRAPSQALVVATVQASRTANATSRGGERRQLRHFAARWVSGASTSPAPTRRLASSTARDLSVPGRLLCGGGGRDCVPDEESAGAE
jgi:hypothetical protein